MHYYATCCRLLYLKYIHMTPKSLLPTKKSVSPSTLTNVPILYYFFDFKKICTSAQRRITLCILASYSQCRYGVDVFLFTLTNKFSTALDCLVTINIPPQFCHSKPISYRPWSSSFCLPVVTLLLISAASPRKPVVKTSILGYFHCCCYAYATWSVGARNLNSAGPDPGTRSRTRNEYTI